MGAPALEIGEHGQVRAWTAGGRGYAAARIRDLDGSLRLVKRSGKSVGEAKRRLANALTHRPDFDDASAGITVGAVAAEWGQVPVSGVARGVLRFLVG